MEAGSPFKRKEIMSLFQLGHFRLHSGGEARWKIDCDALGWCDWEALAVMLVERLPPFHFVRGVPTGGLKLAQCLLDHITPCDNVHPDDRVLLIVDDVCTTGASLEEERQKMAGVFQHMIGAVVFNRGTCPSWVLPLFNMKEMKP